MGFVLYNEDSSKQLLDIILKLMEDNNVNVVVFHLLSPCTIELKETIDATCNKHSIATLWDDDTAIKRYIMSLHNEDGYATVFENLRKRILNAYNISKSYHKHSFKEKSEDRLFVNREKEQESLKKSSSLAFFIQGVSLCGKTSLVKKIVSFYTKTTDSKVFWHTIYDKQDANVITATFWSELHNFFVATHNDFVLQHYFANKSHGYYLTDSLTGILESIFKRYRPIIVVDNVHNCHENNYELNQLFELIVTRKLCRIYFIGWHNVLKRSHLADSLIEKVYVRGLEAEYLDKILKHYTGKSRPDIAKTISDNLYGLPGYATIYDSRMSGESLFAKKDVLAQILKLLVDTEKYVLFALSIASIPINLNVFDKLMLLESLESLHRKNLIESISDNYTVHDNYKPFFSECSLDYSTRTQVISILLEAAKDKPQFFMDVTNIYIDYNNYKMACTILNEKFYDLLHNDFARYLLFIIQKIEKEKGQRNQASLIIKKIITLERCNEYSLCKNLLDVFDGFVGAENNEYEAVFYIKLRIMYFNDSYEEILSLCDTHSQDILKFSPDVRIQVLFIIGRIHYIQGSLREAYILYLICFDAALICENQHLVTKALHRLSMIECSLGHVNESLYAFDSMFVNSPSLTGRRKSFILYRVAKCHYLLKDFKNAIKLCKEAIVVKESFNDTRGIIFVQKLLAKIYLKQNKIKKATKHISNANKLLKSVQILKEEVSVGLVEARIRIVCSEYNMAYSILDFCLSKSIKMKLMFRIKTVISLTKDIVELKNIYNRAVIAYETIDEKDTCEDKLSPSFTSLLSQYGKRLFDNLFIDYKSNLKNILLRSGFDELI